MKSYSRALIAFLVIACLLVPGTLLSQQMSLPLEKSIPANTTKTIQYGGYSLTFTTLGSGIHVKLSMVAWGQVGLSFKRQGASPPGGGSSPATENLTIYWGDSGGTIYNGSPPTSWIDGILTEGGWTEK